MANKYEWKIVGLLASDTEQLKNVVQEVEYEIKATSDDGFTSVGGGRFGLSDPNTENFSDYAQLTEQVAQEWVIQIFGGFEKMVALHAPQLDAQIDMARSAKQANALPWQS
jgi:hypothetical protein